jgi:hypothetical protein
MRSDSNSMPVQSTLLHCGLTAGLEYELCVSTILRA